MASPTNHEEFIQAVQGAKSYKEISQRLGLATNGSQAIKHRLRKLGDRVDTSALVGKKGVYERRIGPDH